MVSVEESSGNPGQRIKEQGITLLTKLHIVKAMVFPVVTDVRAGP